MTRRLRIDPAIKSATRTYQARMRGNEVRAAREMAHLWRAEVLPPYLALAAHGRADSTLADADIDRIEAALQAHVRGLATRWFQPQGRRVLLAAKPWAKAVGVPAAENSFAVQHALEVRRQASIALVENANRVYAADVRKVFTAPGSFGLRVEELRAQLLARAEVSVSRAELIARDQTLKTYAGITEAQHKEAGVTEYVWSTSQDERVRENHARLEGQTCQWSAPPPAGNNGEALNPGEDYQCRCCAIAVIPRS